MQFWIEVALVYNIFTVLFKFLEVHALTGHVCRRQKEETYRVLTNRAFLCSERYTTSCGHLDWRRCTKYRVQTCYTPSERYATRFREVEECCPGWQENAGICSTPVCPGGCRNGGVCSATGAVPHCDCPSAYHGDQCQFRQENSGSNESSSNVPAWMVPVVVTTAVIGAAFVVAIATCLYRKGLPHLVVSTPNPAVHTNAQTVATVAQTVPLQSSIASAPPYDTSTGGPH